SGNHFSVSAMNGLGRLINGFIWDKFGYRVCLTWIAVAFAAGMLCCAFAMMGGNFPLLVAGFMLLGLMYGGNMCSMSAMVGTFFGPKYYGINYAIATCQMIPAAIVGPQILALSQMGSGSYLGAFWVFFGVAIAALIVSLFIKPPKNNRAA
ncbi:MFS transporter, partial [Adlercreutzia sp.]|uniref:MFS transporter n=1 Tax=Adlercreutzia sp. TaxID=1872387 RepID=UPI003AB16B69